MAFPPPKKAPPALAIKFGEAKSPEDDNPDLGEDVDDKGADDTEAAQQAAGDAAIAALHSGDGLSFIKAIVAGVKAGTIDAADLDLGDDDEPHNPWSDGRDDNPPGKSFDLPKSFKPARMD